MITAFHAIGEISVISVSPKESSYEWRIEKYSELDKDAIGRGGFSPNIFFPYAGSYANLIIYPYGDDEDNNTLIHCYWYSESLLNCTLSLKNVNGNQEYEYKHKAKSDGEPIDISHSFPQRSELMRRKGELLPFDTLTIQCTFSVTDPKEIGEISVTRNTCDEISLEWKIKNFSALSDEINSEYSSLGFCFSHSLWCLFISLSCESTYVEIERSREEEKTMSCTFSLKNANKGQEYFIHKSKVEFKDILYHHFPRREELSNRKEELLPSDVLTVQCTLFDVSDPNEIGDISVMRDAQDEISLVWKIVNYSNLSDYRNERYYSPIFTFSDSYWCLQISPNYVRNTHLSIWKESGGERSVHYTLSLTNVHGNEEYVSGGEHHFLSYGARGCDTFPPRSELMRRESELLPSGVLTVRCTLRLVKPCNHRGVLALSDNFKDLFLSGENSDVIIKVRERKFPVHSLILCARSPVFSAMFKHDMKERNDGVVDIPDCDPGAFRDFLLYLYAGQLDEIPKDNVFHLFEISDKYNVDDLKEKCVKVIVEELSVDTVCDALTLATKHDHSELLKAAVEYFVGNTAAILPTVKWQIYHRDNPTAANELFIKAFASVSQKL